MREDIEEVLRVVAAGLQPAADHVAIHRARQRPMVYAERGTRGVEVHPKDEGSLYLELIFEEDFPPRVGGDIATPQEAVTAAISHLREKSP